MEEASSTVDDDAVRMDGKEVDSYQIIYFPFPPLTQLFDVKFRIAIRTTQGVS